MYQLFLSLVTVSSVQAASHGYSWAYSGAHGEKTWPTNYGFCGGVYQSPLDFHENILQYDSSLRPIKLFGYDVATAESFTVSNNGHSVSVTLVPTMKIEIEPFHYTASQLHLHWGHKNNPKGSEHCIEGRRFPAEVHVVHYNSDKYTDITKATEAADGLAVLGILIEVGSFNPSFENILSHLNSIKYKDQSIQIAGFNVQELFPKRLDEYFRYEGSLTTPPCNPSVLWTVFRNPVLISEAQLFALETTLYCTDRNSSEPIQMTNNYRQLQAHGDRLVSVSFREGVVLTVALACGLGVLVVLVVTCVLIHRKRSRKPADNKNIAYVQAAGVEENTSKV
ncbi:hypothetical protein GDO86_006119 [Hymenochirus boettgeri]|uniref:Carbonic anhydrase n=1 Tax=Hymenochirus boettgeri TaxID=247094 RepID=A0A8T2J9R1_9PIPI|nr:hypothetical protein GDO86_006119 [Hymenochirus boettgeri]